MENKYKKGKIYKIESSQISKVYIGSTTSTLPQRMKSHRRNYKLKIEGDEKIEPSSSIEILCFDDATIVLIEDYPCDSKKDLLLREQYWIDRTDCVNKYRAIKTFEDTDLYRKQYYQNNMDKNKKQCKEYREKHREELKQNDRDRYKNNSEKMKEQAKIYRATKAEEIKIKKKIYYDENREKILLQKKSYDANKKKLV